MDEDSEILSYAQELYRQIIPGRREPDSVSWDDSLPDDRVIVLYGDVTLPQRMKGKLRAQEWRPLIASAILYSREFRAKQRRGALIRIVLPAGLGEVLLVYALLQVLKKGNPQSSDLLFLVILGWTIFISLLIALYSYWIFRTAQYEADKSAAAIVGPQSIVQSLLKIQGVTSTLPATKRRYSLRPNLNQRIKKLQKLSPGSQRPIVLR